MPTLSKSYLICIGTTSFSLGYVHYKKGHLKVELTQNVSFLDNSHSLCDFHKNSRCSEKDSGIREQIPELRVLSTFIPKAENRYLKNFSPAALWQLFSYDIDCFHPFCLRYMPFYITMLRIRSIPLIFLWEEHSIRKAWEQPTGGLGSPPVCT